MRYTLAQAEAFYWTARLRGFRAAATKLNLAQPTVSLRVQELERVLDGTLFDRSGYRPVPSALGRAIYDDIERMLRIADAVQRRAQAPASLRGPIRIGAADSFAARVLPALLARLARLHPALQVDVTVEPSTRLAALLQDGQIDIAFLSQPTAQAGLRLMPLWSIPLVWAVGRRLGYDSPTATPAAMVDLPIFTNPAPSNLFTSIQSWFGAAGLQPRRINTCGPLHIIARLASAGTGAALLPIEVIEDSPERDEIIMLDADPGVPPHRMCALWWANQAEAECALLASLAAEIGAPAPELVPAPMAQSLQPVTSTQGGQPCAY